MKRCFRCGAMKPLDQFYAHPRMADGHFGKCKDCTRDDSTANRRAKPEQYAKYESDRNKEPVRRVLKGRYQRRTAARHREKIRARSAVARALRAGTLVRQPRRVCGGEKSEAHHSDYSKPLLVDWLCKGCHEREHHPIPF